MTPHPIRIVITPAGVLCGVCDRAVVWVRWAAEPWGDDVGHWAHREALEASMRRHPAGKGRKS